MSSPNISSEAQKLVDDALTLITPVNNYAASARKVRELLRAYM